MNVLMAVEKGAFSARMPRHYSGVAAKVADRLNAIVELNDRLMKELDRVSTLVGPRWRAPVIVYTGRDLTSKEEAKLRKRAKSIIVKDVRSPRRPAREGGRLRRAVPTGDDRAPLRPPEPPDRRTAGRRRAAGGSSPPTRGRSPSRAEKARARRSASFCRPRLRRSSRPTATRPPRRRARRPRALPPPDKVESGGTAPRDSGFFIVLEGPDLSGKSTQAARLVAALKARGRPVVHTREPGGTALSEAVRKLLLDVRSRISPLAELLLYEAARAQHADETLRPALSRGDVVVCERYTLATLAYQGFGRRLPLPVIRELNKIATGGLEPDLTIVVDASEAALAGRSRGPKDRLESEAAEFQARVREGYRKLSKGKGIVRVDGARPPDAVAEEILGIVLNKLGAKTAA